MKTHEKKSEVNQLITAFYTETPKDLTCSSSFNQLTCLMPAFESFLKMCPNGAESEWNIRTGHIVTFTQSLFYWTTGISTEKSHKAVRRVIQLCHIFIVPVESSHVISCQEVSREAVMEPDSRNILNVIKDQQ